MRKIILYTVAILALLLLIVSFALGQSPRYVTLKRRFGPGVIPSEETIRYEVVRIEYDTANIEDLQLPARDMTELPYISTYPADTFGNVLMYDPKSHMWRPIDRYGSIAYSSQPMGVRVIGGTYPALVDFDAVSVNHVSPDNAPDFAWNNAPYFRSSDYLSKPDKRFFDWSNYVTTWDGKQAAIWGLFALSGAAHGLREAYHADPYLFERRNGVAPTSFWGSDAWKRNYIGNDPDNPHKHEWAGNVGRDVWHTFNQVDLIPLGTACITMGARRHPVKYKVANTLAGIGLRVLFANITYATLRNTR